jgi:hypothetical protein
MAGIGRLEDLLVQFMFRLIRAAQVVRYWIWYIRRIVGWFLHGVKVLI